MNWQPSPHQRQKLLVEDQERLQLGFLGPSHTPARSHRKDVISSLHKPMTQLIRRSSRLRLLLHLAPLIRQLDDKLSHALLSSAVLPAFKGISFAPGAPPNPIMTGTPPYLAHFGDPL